MAKRLISFIDPVSNSSAGGGGPKGLGRARGCIDAIRLTGEQLHVAGWILHPRHALDHVKIYVNGVFVGEGPLTLGRDVAEGFPHIAHAENSRFNVRGNAKGPSGPGLTVAVEGYAGESAKASFQWYELVEAKPGSAFPGEHLVQRVTGEKSTKSYARLGLNVAVDLLRAVEKHRGLDRAHALLDWGCGPGRVATYLSRLWTDFSLTGCDIDAEAVAWCKQVLPGGSFHVTAPYPPLPFADESFDAVVASSVMTHLAWPEQRAWLPEIRRILRREGVFAASVHGCFAASFFPGLLARLETKGIIDDGRDPSLDGIAPPGYYRAVFQTPSFTLKSWGDDFEVLDYIEAGLAGFQDLVVLRRRG